MSGLGDCGESELLERARAGDVEAFADLYRHHYPAVLAACGRRQASDAEEVAQAAFLRAFERIDQCRGDDARFGPWVQAIARHVWVDTCRARSRALARAAQAGQPSPGDDWPEEHALRRERAEALWSVVQSLPPRQRQVLYARAVEGRRPGEIAAALGVSLGAVDSLLLRARRAAAAGYRTMAAESGLSQTASTAAVAVAGGGATSGPRRITGAAARALDAARGALARLGGYTALPGGLDLVAGAAIVVALAGPNSAPVPAATAPTATAPAATAPAPPPGGEALAPVPGADLPSPGTPVPPTAPEPPAADVPENPVPPPPDPPNPAEKILSIADVEAAVSGLSVPQVVDLPRTGFDPVDRRRPAPGQRPGRDAWEAGRARGGELWEEGRSRLHRTWNELRRR